MRDRPRWRIAGSTARCDTIRIQTRMGEAMRPTAALEGTFGRILEVGEHCLIGRGMPAITDFACTSISRRPPDLPATLCLLSQFAAIRALRSGTYGLVVAHAPAYASFRLSVLRSVARRPVRRGPAWFLRGSLLSQIPRHIPVVMLDMEDPPILYAHNLPLLDRALLCFKRELPADRDRVFMRAKAPALPEPTARASAVFAARIAKLRPISVGLSEAVLRAAPAKPAEKTSDIFFAGEIRGSSTVRRAGADELNRLESRGVRVDFAAERIGFDEFLRRAAASRLVWSPEGLGHDCFRHYEAGACWAVPVINTPGIERHRPLLDGVHALYYPVEPGGLTRVVVDALREPDRLAVMGRAGRRHVTRHHTHRALSEYVLNEAAALVRGLPRTGAEQDM